MIIYDFYRDFKYKSVSLLNFGSFASLNEKPILFWVIMAAKIVFYFLVLFRVFLIVIRV